MKTITNPKALQTSHKVNGTCILSTILKSLQNYKNYIKFIQLGISLEFHVKYIKIECYVKMAKKVQNTS